MRNCPWVGRLKLAASVRERPLTMGSLTRSRNSYAVSSKILRTNESNLRNYLFNKIFVRNSTYMHFPIPSFEQEKNLRKILKNVGNKFFQFLKLMNYVKNKTSSWKVFNEMRIVFSKKKSKKIFLYENVPLNELYKMVYFIFRSEKYFRFYL